MLLFALAIALCACARTAPDRQPAQDDLVALGAQLFSDPRLSIDGSVSCATCHDPQLAFTDGKPVSIGVHGRKGTRNAPSLLDVQQMDTFFWEGREADLADVVLQPFTNAAEMGHDSPQAAVGAIAGIADYQTGFLKAIGSESPNADDISRALVAYLDSLEPGASRYERAVAAGDLSILGQEALAGLQLFQGKAQCGSCHLADRESRPFTDNRFHHAGIGFDRIAGNLTPLLERIAALERTATPLGQLVLEDRDIAELGRFVVTRKPQDLGAFRTPTLRNVANTAPYMHDGSVATLEDAIERELYYRGIALGRPINLTVEEQRQLAAFLQAL